MNIKAFLISAGMILSLGFALPALASTFQLQNGASGAPVVEGGTVYVTSTYNAIINSTYNNDGYLYNSNDSNPNTWASPSTDCIGNAFHCQYRIAPMVGDTLQQKFFPFNPAVLNDNTVYKWFDTPSSNCAGATDLPTCIANQGGAGIHEIDVSYCTDGSCFPSGGGGTPCNMPSGTPAAIASTTCALIENIKAIIPPIGNTATTMIFLIGGIGLLVTIAGYIFYKMA